ncbi:hypothetical protein [Vibrio salinus]|uniref:hypothetical protein n=1 Tax=Vibrio salinus TaxID=2899784 RepID=UPI001E2C853F|nr:hypothetical protein [Vibrio salinus]MCE0495766.1 hypothetical protein [Vibrio salinus]
MIYNLRHLTNNMTAKQVANALRKTEKDWRGMGQGMTLAIQGFNGGTSTHSRTCRTRHHSKVRFRKVRAVIPTFYLTGNPIKDTDIANDLNFQVGIESKFKESLTGISPRIMFKFGGDEVAKYLNESAPETGYIISDVLDLNGYIEPDQDFGLWTTVEAPNSDSNALPYTKKGSSHLQRYEGVIQNDTGNIENDLARSASEIPAFTKVQTGETTWFAPCFLLIYTDSANPFVVDIGSSSSYGVGEGTAGSLEYGDSRGSLLGNSGFFERPLDEELGWSYVNFSKGSDGNKYLRDPENWKYRKQLLQLANPTHVINSNISNDISADTDTLSGRSSSTAYEYLDTKTFDNRVWICIRPGTTASSQPESLGDIENGEHPVVVDGSCTWQYLGSLKDDDGNTLSSEVRRCYLDFQFAVQVNHQIKEAVGVPVYQMVCNPKTNSTDDWATVENQTPRNGWGDKSSRRGRVNELIRENLYIMSTDEYVDPNPTYELEYPLSETSIWKFLNATTDGTHLNSFGYSSGQKGMAEEIKSKIIQ